MPELGWPLDPLGNKFWKSQGLILDSPELGSSPSDGSRSLPGGFRAAQPRRNTACPTQIT